MYGRFKKKKAWFRLTAKDRVVKVGSALVTIPYPIEGSGS